MTEAKKSKPDKEPEGGILKPGDACPCQSGKPYGKCCGPLLTGQAKAKTPRQLMRSRYTAYALGGQGDYLLATWHPSTAGAVSRADFDLPPLKWKGLQILHSEQKGDTAIVEFKARHEEEGRERVHHERSLFHRLNGRWFYVQGEVAEEDP